MIIYGWRSAHLKTKQLDTCTCPSCGTKGSVITSVFSRHVHIFWIPLFPIGKTGAAQCQHCGFVMEKKEMPEDIKQEYGYLKSETRPPFWQFAGLLIITSFVAWGVVMSGKHDEDVQTWLEQPSKGDVYRYKTEGNYYSTMKVIEVTQDSLRVALNEYETDKKSGVYKLDKSQNYSEEFSYMLGKDQVREMYSSGTIYDIDR
jgi:rubredoxin